MTEPIPEVLAELPDVSGEDFQVSHDILDAIKANNEAGAAFKAFQLHTFEFASLTSRPGEHV